VKEIKLNVTPEQLHILHYSPFQLRHGNDHPQHTEPRDYDIHPEHQGTPQAATEYSIRLGQGRTLGEMDGEVRRSSSGRAVLAEILPEEETETETA
jgi:hypothetical protein